MSTSENTRAAVGAPSSAAPLANSKLPGVSAGGVASGAPAPNEDSPLPGKRFIPSAVGAGSSRDILDFTPLGLRIENLPCGDARPDPTPAQSAICSDSFLESPAPFDWEQPISPTAPALLEYQRYKRMTFAEALQKLRNCEGGLHEAINSASLNGLSELLPPRVVHDAVFEAADGKWRASGELYSEIWRTLASAIHFLSGTRLRSSGCSAPRVDPDYQAAERVVLDNPNLQELVAASKAMPASRADILGALFPRGTLLCCARSTRVFATMPVEYWRENLHLVNLLVPNPMTAQYGRTLAGHMSQKSAASTGPRRYQILEWDFKPESNPACGPFVARMGALGFSAQDLCAGLLWHLQKFVPMAMAVFSGNSSIHGWFPCTDLTEGDVIKFQTYARKLGADSALFSPSQFTRAPGGRHNNGVPQTVVFWNPEVLP